jgi:hypothetical protein
MGIRGTIYKEFSKERNRQEAKWGPQSHPMFNPEHLSRNIALRKSYQDSCDDATKEKKLTWEDILLEEVWEALSEESPYRQWEELIHVGAVVTSMLEDLHRKIGDVE